MTVTITGTFLNAVGDGPATGRGFIEPSVPVLQDGTVLVSGTAFTLDAGGSFAVPVLATDDPTLTPPNFTYRLGIYLTDHTPRRLADVYFLAPAAVSPLDVADLIDLGSPIPGSDPLNPTEYSVLDARLDLLEAEADMVTFALPGALSVLSGTSRLYNDSGTARQVTTVRASVGTAPTGSPVVVDVKKDGTSLYGVTAPPTISAGANTGASVPDTTTWQPGEFLTVDVTAVGSSVAGSNLTVTVSYR